MSELILVTREDIANGYLKLGWVLIGVSQTQYSEHGYSASFTLAWPSKRDEPQLPKIRTIEDLMKEKMKEKAP